MSEFGGLRKHEKIQHALKSGRIIISLLIMAIRKCVKHSESISYGEQRYINIISFFPLCFCIIDVIYNNNDTNYHAYLVHYYYYQYYP